MNKRVLNINHKYFVHLSVLLGREQIELGKSLEHHANTIINIRSHIFCPIQSSNHRSTKDNAKRTMHYEFTICEFWPIIFPKLRMQKFQSLHTHTLTPERERETQCMACLCERRVYRRWRKRWHSQISKWPSETTPCDTLSWSKWNWSSRRMREK